MSENALKESSLGPRFSDVAGVMPVLACVTTRRHDKARAEIFEWIDVWHQRIRIYGSLGYVRPEAFEATERVG